MQAYFGLPPASSRSSRQSEHHVASATCARLSGSGHGLRRCCVTALTRYTGHDLETREEPAPKLRLGQA